MEFNPALNNKTILEHTAAAAAASPVVVSASSDQQIGKIHHPLLGSKQRAAAATNVNQFPDALPLDQPAVAPLDHDLAAASLFDQPAAGLANGPSTYVLTTNKCDAWNFASRICHLLILQLE